MFTWLRKSLHESTVPQPFDCIKAIQMHIDHRERIESYVCGSLQGPLDVPTGCHKDCALGEWLKDADSKQCEDIGLLNAICRNCEEFYEAASQVVLLADMRESASAKAALQDGQMFADASEALQQNLARLHIGYL